MKLSLCSFLVCVLVTRTLIGTVTFCGPLLDIFTFSVCYEYVML
jgi:hypothetical protein